MRGGKLCTIRSDHDAELICVGLQERMSRQTDE